MAAIGTRVRHRRVADAASAPKTLGKRTLVLVEIDTVAVDEPEVRVFLNGEQVVSVREGKGSSP